mgnify:CR=1 FL=1
MASHARAVLAYARYLGVDPETEPNLLPVAHEALTGPLPPGWERHLDEVHLMPFFYSDEGGFTTWQHPQLGLYLRKLDELRGAAAQKAQAAQAALHQQSTTSTTAFTTPATVANDSYINQHLAWIKDFAAVCGGEVDPPNHAGGGRLAERLVLGNASLTTHCPASLGAGEYLFATDYCQ